MKALKKYAYMSPETEILSLEAKRIIMDSPVGPVPEPEEGGTDPGGWGSAPWRY